MKFYLKAPLVIGLVFLSASSFAKKQEFIIYVQGNTGPFKACFKSTDITDPTHCAKGGDDKSHTYYSGPKNWGLQTDVPASGLYEIGADTSCQRMFSDQGTDLYKEQTSPNADGYLYINVTASYFEVPDSNLMRHSVTFTSCSWGFSPSN